MLEVKPYILSQKDVYAIMCALVPDDGSAHTAFNDRALRDVSNVIEFSLQKLEIGPSILPVKLKEGQITILLAALEEAVHEASMDLSGHLSDYLNRCLSADNLMADYMAADVSFRLEGHVLEFLGPDSAVLNAYKAAVTGYIRTNAMFIALQNKDLGLSLRVQASNALDQETRKRIRRLESE